MAILRFVSAHARVFILFAAVAMGPAAGAAPYAAMVVDARSGEVLHEENADARLHPASLTKMMTVYLAFEAVRDGRIGLDDEVTITANAAAEPWGLGLRAGQRIKFRYLIRAAAVKSSNDAATAIGDAVAGNETAFVALMNRKAAEMGMSRTTFENAHGLTSPGHLSTARDMTNLGRRLLYDWPQYYNLFSRQTADAGVKRVNHTNTRFLKAYRGADGIKTGYTRAAGYTLVASAERGSERIITTVFGGRSTASRNARVAELMDLGFAKAPSHVPVAEPGPLNSGALIARSLRPHGRPAPAAPAPQQVARMGSTVPLDQVQVASAVPTREEVARAVSAALPEDVASPVPRPAASELEVVARLSSSGGRHWGINLGQYATRYQAEQVLLKTALTEIDTLDDALRKVVQSPAGWQANFVGMTEERADLACRRLSARELDCETLGPGPG